MFGRLLLVFSYLFTVLGAFYALDKYPPYLDFDVATEATFVNNLAHHDNIYHYFDSHNRKYDSTPFATHRLVFSLLLSPLVKTLSIAPYEMEEFFKFLSAILILIGTVAAAFVFSSANHRSYTYYATLAALGLSQPALFVFARVGTAFNLLSFALFWLILAFITSYLRSGSAVALYFAGALSTLAAFNLYPPLAALPPLALCFVLYHRALGSCLTSKHFYISLSFAAALYVVVTLFIADRYAGGLEEYRRSYDKFLGFREYSISIERQLLGEKFSDKLIKLKNQHLTFSHDDLGDPKREDDVFTLGNLHLVWLGMTAFMVYGAICGVGRKDRGTVLALISVGVIWTLFLSVSFPEGRYISIAVPAYLYLAYYGLQSLFNRKLPRSIALSALIILQASNSYLLTFGPFSDYVAEVWKDCEGHRALAENLPVQEENSIEYIGLPWPKKNKTWHYFAVVTNLRAEWVGVDELIELSESFRENPPERLTVLYYVDESLSTQNTKKVLAAGFKPIREFRTRNRDKPRVLLKLSFRPPPEGI